MKFFSKIRARLERRRPPVPSPGGADPALAIRDGDDLHRDAVAGGKSALAARDYAKAAGFFRAAIDLKHDDGGSYCGLGIAHMKLQQYEDAADCFQMAAHFCEEDAEPHYQLGLLAERQGDPASAVVHLGNAILRCPDHADSHNLLGACLLRLRDTEGAAASFGRAVAISPDNAHFQSNLGFVLLRDLGDAERGAMHLETALRLNADDPAIQCNYSFLLAYRGRNEEVVALCDRLLAANPALTEARLNRALALLKMERYADAWPDYEARKQTRSNYLPRPYVFPEWSGEPLDGKTLLVYGEQGLGDEIMFASCLPDVINAGARCIVECSPRLEKLIRRSFPAATVHGALQTSGDTRWLAGLGTVDYQIAAGSLPGLYRRQRADFPRHDGYLRPAPERVEHWAERLSALGPEPKVGIAWRGGTVSTRGALRSLDLRLLTPLLQRRDLHFVSLQYDATVAEVSGAVAAQGFNLCHWPEAIEDIDESAALMPALDLIITVCNASVHLAGAVGRPAWALVPAVPEWRYLQAGDRLPWYPSVRMFRQTAAGDWQSVVDEIGQALCQRYPV